MNTEERIGRIEARLAALESAAHSGADIGGQYGDPDIRKDPTAKYWGGGSFIGKKMSACPPDYLDAFAKYKDACAFMNAKENDPQKTKYAEYDKRDAARARAWAAKMRAGGSAAAPSIGSGFDMDGDQAPF